MSRVYVEDLQEKLRNQKGSSHRLKYNLQLKTKEGCGEDEGRKRLVSRGALRRG